MAKISNTGTGTAFAGLVEAMDVVNVFTEPGILLRNEAGGECTIHFDDDTIAVLKRKSIQIEWTKVSEDGGTYKLKISSVGDDTELED